MTAAATTARVGSVSWGVDAPRIRCQLVLADGVTFVFGGDVCDRGPHARGRILDLSRGAAQALGVPQLLAVQLVRDASGWYTGEIDGIPTMREGKVRRMEQWLAERRLAWGDVESTFYSDSMNDVPLLEKVNHPVATNPDARLRALAHERGWRILDLFSDGTNQNAQPATAQDAAP